MHRLVVSFELAIIILKVLWCQIITNRDDVVYFGRKPVVQEVGPYTFIETEHKRNMSWDGAGNSVWYQNYKTWTFNESLSCPTCKYSDYVTVPNAAFYALIGKMLTASHTATLPLWVLNVGLLLLGEYPIRTVPVRGVLFEGYDDPLISILNSGLFKEFLSDEAAQIKLLGFTVPNLPRMGYFVNYNNSADESYYVNTGKDCLSNGDRGCFGKIKTWANMDSLPEKWWSTPEARAINGSDGSLNPPFMEKTDVVYMFNSFLCRSLTLNFDSTTSYRSIPTYRFVAGKDVYDTTLPQNAGFRYNNIENAKYFFNTTALPPGMFPLRCFPGKNQDAPFNAIFSAPHFYYAPPEVVNSISGLNPNPDLHTPAVFDIEPTSGTPMEGLFRLQVSFPMYPLPFFSPQLNKLTKPYIIPTFWLESHVTINDNVYDTVVFTFVVLPKLILGIGIGLTLLAALIIVLSLFCAFRGRRQSKHNPPSGGGGNNWQDYVNVNDHLPDANDRNKDDVGVAGPSRETNVQSEKY
uniref:Uncharacterized protein n=1 Tax=Plectus sambesii TaxID=2011161 RepID=A0A914V2F0_9BILA